MFKDQLTKTAVNATLHCLTGCAIGEIAGLIIGTALGWSAFSTIALAVALAFLFGYSFTMLPLLKSGLTLAAALPIALTADTISIATMEIIDNAIMLAIPGAMEAPLTHPVFWLSLSFALFVAFLATVPVNRYLIARGKGHAAVHAYHNHDGHEGHHGHDMHAAHAQKDDAEQADHCCQVKPASDTQAHHNNGHEHHH